MSEVWSACSAQLEEKLSTQEYNTWIRPLQVEVANQKISLFAPNRFVERWVRDNYWQQILEVTKSLPQNHQVDMHVGAPKAPAPAAVEPKKALEPTLRASTPSGKKSQLSFAHDSGLDPDKIFSNFVEGKSNQFARAAAHQVAETGAYNPLFIYGGVGLGKTHLMHAVGNSILERKNNAKVLYLHSERFVADMVKALQNNAINAFKQYYRSVDALLIDDIQFFAGKDRSQEEFFHTFNALMEGNQHIIMTCDRYPKEISGLEERLKSRFGWGLTVAIEPPDLETRVAIIMNKSEQAGVKLEYEVAFFIAKRIRSNVRELEGALKRVLANSKFTGRDITIDFVKETLKDLISLQDKLVTLDNIIKTTAEYYKLKVADILSKRRNRSVARPRQLGMALAKELTSHSLPEIGYAFGGRDHTTVLHAVRAIAKFKETDLNIAEDYANLIRSLTT